MIPPLSRSTRYKGSLAFRARKKRKNPFIRRAAHVALSPVYVLELLLLRLYTQREMRDDGGGSLSPAPAIWTLAYTRGRVIVS